MLEDLLCYLMGVLEPAQARRVEEALQRDPDLRRQFEKLRASLEATEDADGGSTEFDSDSEPPAGLAERACELVFDFEDEVEPCLERGLERGPNRDPDSAGGDSREPVTSQASRHAARLQPASAVAAHRSWSAADAVVAAGVFLAAAMLFFPAILNSQFLAQKVACQNNLRQLGYALATFSQNDPQQRFPCVPVEGNRSFAGIYAPLLRDSGYLENTQVLFCPTSEWVREARRLEVPAMEQIDEARGRELTRLQRISGCSYGYNLGHHHGGRHVAPKNLGRSGFVLMTDTPSRYLSDGRSASHGATGQNMLYEDGHVQFVPNTELPDTMDHPFRNHRGFVEAGVGPDDAVIGDSSTPPFLER